MGYCIFSGGSDGLIEAECSTVKLGSRAGMGGDFLEIYWSTATGCLRGEQASLHCGKLLRTIKAKYS